MRLGTVATSMRPDPLLLQCASSYVGAMVLDPRRMKIGLHCLGCAPLWSDPRRLMSSSSAAPCVTSATFKLQRAPDYDMVLALQLPGPVPHEARKWRSALIRLVQDALMILYVSPHDHFVRYMSTSQRSAHARRYHWKQTVIANRIYQVCVRYCINCFSP